MTIPFSRKLAVGIAMNVMAATAVLSASATAAASIHIGDVVGDVLSTDIVAEVNGSVIRSMNIDGLTAIVAEDLRDYGFDVAWVPQHKEVVIIPVAGKQIRPHEAESAAPSSVGRKLGPVLFTDIAAKYADKPIRSFNIDGRTAIVMNDLAAFGKLDWSPQTRKLSFKSDAGAAKQQSLEGYLVARELDPIRVEGIAITDDAVSYNGINVGIVVNGRPYLSIEWLAGQLGYEAEAVSNGTVELTADGNTIDFRAGEKSVNRYWLGATISPFELYEPPIVTNGVMYVHETSLKGLLGYASVWNPDSRILDLTYHPFVVEDYGLPESSDTYMYAAKMFGDISGQYEIPGIRAINRINGGSAVGSFSGGGLDANNANNPYKYSFGSVAPANIGTNEIEITVGIGGRMLYLKQFTFELTHRNVNPLVDTSAVSGNFTRLQQVSPEQAYAETAADTFTVSGTVAAQTVGSLTVKVAKDDDPQTVSSTASVPIQDSRFETVVPLPAEPGLYRITVSSLVTFPRGTSETAVAKWYVRKLAKP
ncbi:stalk domain-containing protein [Paenibacillus periandrae]|uniref:stalk domain-containing protein n=1 Tax=Paenibacillus periandrae TaxID=1761741 RepID=UPI001F0918AE|nr:stalk domain-containing protein [Paenibacillus periandrae]